MLIQINWNPDRKELRKFGVTLFGLLVVFGALLGWKFHSLRLFEIIAGAGAVAGVLCICLPPAGLLIYKAWMGLGYAMGMVMSPVFLGVVYFGIFTPMGLVMRLFGRDPLQRRKSATASYWREVQHRTEPASYERQF